MTEYVWAARYCPCRFESAPRTISVHRTAVGAFNAMRARRDAEMVFQDSVRRLRCFKGEKDYWYTDILRMEVQP